MHNFILINGAQKNKTMFGGFFCKKRILELEKELQRLAQESSFVADFLKNISAGNEKSLAREDVKDDNLFEALQEIQTRYNKLNKEDAHRNWTFVGVEKIVNLIRGNSLEAEKILSSLTSTLCKYAKANQAAIFVLNAENPNNEFFELKSLFAYDKRKHLSMTVNMGESLVSECYLEGSAIYMTDVPTNYVKITSGLGEATPRSILLIPLIFDETKVGVIEFAFFHKLEPFELEFLSKVSEHIASYIIRENQSNKTKAILEHSEKQTELLRSREEELNQNMEEMKIIQEQMEKRNKELELANQEIERQSREMDEIKKHEMELFESKLETQKTLHNLTIKKLTAKIAELEKRELDQMPRLRIVN